MSVIRWEEPPVNHGNAKPKPPSKFQPIADELRANPGRWALVAEDKLQGTAGTLAHRIRTGIAPFKPGRFEAKVVGPASPEPKSKVYARYAGAES